MKEKKSNDVTEETDLKKKKKESKKKILIISLISLVIIALVAGLIAYFNPYLFYDIYGNYLSKKEFPQKQETIVAQQPTGQKLLIICQPSVHTTITEDMAHKIALGASEKGLEVTIDRPGKNRSTDISKYDLVIFGSPWYMHPSQPLIKYIRNLNSLSNKKVYLFITQGGEDTYTDVFKEIADAAKEKGANIISKELYTAEKLDKSLDEAYNFGKRIGTK